MSSTATSTTTTKTRTKTIQTRRDLTSGFKNVTERDFNKRAKPKDNGQRNKSYANPTLR